MLFWGQKVLVPAGKRKVSIFAFAFATPPEAFANQVLRRATVNRVEILQKLGVQVHVYTQPDLGIGLPSEIVPTMIEEEVGKPSPTLRIARNAVAWAKENGTTEIRIVAAAPHVWRCVRDTKAAMREAKLKLPIVVERISEVGWFGWFDKSSTQKRTRSVFFWYLRDVILWITPLTIYKRKAG